MASSADFTESRKALLPAHPRLLRLCLEPVARSGVWGGVEGLSRGGEKGQMEKTRRSEVKKSKESIHFFCILAVCVCVCVKVMTKWTKTILHLGAC